MNIPEIFAGFNIADMNGRVRFLAVVGMQIKEARRRCCCVMLRAATKTPTALIVKLFVWTFIRTVELDWG